MLARQALRLSFIARTASVLRTSTACPGPSVCAHMATIAPAEERFDVLNADGSLAGHSKARSAVHRDGDLHRSTHIWVLSTAAKPVRLLLQLRAAGKDTFPGRWDVSAAGHITAGDESLPSAEREVQEELGLKIGEGGSRLQFAFSARASARGHTNRHGAFVDNEIQDVYLFRRDKEVEVDELVLQKEEVESVQYWTWPEFRDAQRSGDARFVPRSKEYVDLMEDCIESWADDARSKVTEGK